MTEDLMTEEELDKLIRMVASKHHVSPEEVRKSMEISVHDAWVRAKDHPATQLLWSMCPHKGDEPTLCEFFPFLNMLVLIDQAKAESPSFGLFPYEIVLPTGDDSPFA